MCKKLFIPQRGRFADEGNGDDSLSEDDDFPPQAQPTVDRYNDVFGLYTICEELANPVNPMEQPEPSPTVQAVPLEDSEEHKLEPSPTVGETALEDSEEHKQEPSPTVKGGTSEDSEQHKTESTPKVEEASEDSALQNEKMIPTVSTDEFIYGYCCSNFKNIMSICPTQIGVFSSHC